MTPRWITIFLALCLSITGALAGPKARPSVGKRSGENQHASWTVKKHSMGTTARRTRYKGHEKNGTTSLDQIFNGEQEIQAIRKWNANERPTSTWRMSS